MLCEVRSGREGLLDPELLERRFHALENAIPRAAGTLAENLHGGIPRRVFAPDQPAPAAGLRERQPDGFAHGASQVRNAGARRDHQVEVGDHGGRLQPVAALVVFAEVPDIGVDQVLAVPLLERDQIDPGNLRQGANWSTVNERRASLSCLGLPRQATPTRNPGIGARRVSHFRIVSSSADR